MSRQTNSKVVGAILTTGCLLLAAQYIGAAPQHGNSEIASRARGSSGARWKAHPEKGWIPAAEDERARGEKKNSKPVKKKFQANTSKKQN
jgi:hypothetical protein